MRNLILIILTISYYSGHAQTQSDTNKGNSAGAKSKFNWITASDHVLDLGVEGGPSVIFLYGDKFFSQHEKPACGFSGAFFVQYNFPKVLSVRTNIAFERKGNMTSGILEATDQNGYNLGSYNYRINNNSDYLTLPILVRATFGDKIKLFINAGPYLGALLNDELVTRTNGEKYGLPAKVSKNVTNESNRLDIGLTTGIGLEVPIKKGFSLSFEARNNTGLYNTANQPLVYNGTRKNNSTNFLLGFSYALGKRST